MSSRRIRSYETDRIAEVFNCNRAVLFDLTLCPWGELALVECAAEEYLEACSPCVVDAGTTFIVKISSCRWYRIYDYDPELDSRSVEERVQDYVYDTPIGLEGQDLAQHLQDSHQRLRTDLENQYGFVAHPEADHIFQVALSSSSSGRLSEVVEAYRFAAESKKTA